MNKFLLLGISALIILAMVNVVNWRARGVLQRVVQRIRTTQVVKQTTLETNGVLNTVSAASTSVIQYLQLERTLDEWKAFPPLNLVVDKLAPLLPLLPTSLSAPVILESFSVLLAGEIAKQVNTMMPLKHAFDKLQASLAGFETAIKQIPDLLKKRDGIVSELAALKLAARASSFRQTVWALVVACLLAGEGGLIYMTWSVTLADAGPVWAAVGSGASAITTIAFNEGLTIVGLAPLYLRLLKRVKSRDKAGSPSSRPAVPQQNATPIPLSQQIRRIRIAEVACVCGQVLWNSLSVLLRREWVSEESEKVYIASSIVALLGLSLMVHFCIEKILAHFRQAKLTRKKIGVKARERTSVESELVHLLGQQKMADALQTEVADLSSTFKAAKESAQAELASDPHLRANITYVAKHLVRTAASAPVVVPLVAPPTPSIVSHNGAGNKTAAASKKGQTS